MAGNNSIQILRGAGHGFTDQLLPGQPYYDYINNKLYIGGSVNTPINQAKAIGEATIHSSSIYVHLVHIASKNSPSSNVDAYITIASTYPNIGDIYGSLTAPFNGAVSVATGRIKGTSENAAYFYGSPYGSNYGTQFGTLYGVNGTSQRITGSQYNVTKISTQTITIKNL